jgi:hypothetical protein
MKDKLLKYLLLIVLLIQVIIFVYLSTYFSVNENIENYNQIIISGNNLLPERIYLNSIATELIKKQNSLNFIKSEFEKHPYILNADVKLTSQNNIEVKLKEKEMYASFVYEGEWYFITNHFEKIKMIPFTIEPSLPIIITNKWRNSFETKNNVMVTSFKIIDTLSEMNKELHDRLTEINISTNENLIVLRFRNINSQIWISKTNLIKELITLNELLNYKDGSLVNENVRYIDLRFNNQIIIG